MRQTIVIILLILFAVAISLCSCNKSELKKPTPSLKIKWDVISVNNTDTKSLISSYDDLQNACTPEENGGKGKSIGFYADRQDAEGEIHYNIFGTKETQLIYKDKIGSPEGQIWNYTRKDEYGNALDDLEWDNGSTYHIRAFYPQSLHNLIEPSTVARCFVMNYNTHKTQEDLLVAYNRVYTIDPVSSNPSICIAKGASNEIESTITDAVVDSKTVYGYSQPFDLSNPIPLYFRHALAAIRIRLKFDYDLSDDDIADFHIWDELLNCYFINSNNTEGLRTTGALVFGNEHTEHDEAYYQANKAQYEVLESYWKGLTWKSEQSSMAGVPYYRWGLSTEDIEAGEKKGTRIARKSTGNGTNRTVLDSMAVAYTYFRTQDVNTSTSPYIVSTDSLAMSLKNEAPYFNQNDGWLLIIPQKAVRGLMFNFTTRRMGLVSAQVPPITMTGANGPIELSPGPDPLANAKAEDNYYLPGYRYTYTLTISETDIHLDLSISDWDELYASEDIIF